MQVKKNRLYGDGVEVIEPVQASTLPLTPQALSTIDNIDFMGLPIYTKKEPLYKSEIIGIPIYGIAIIGVIYALMKK